MYKEGVIDINRHNIMIKYIKTDFIIDVITCLSLFMSAILDNYSDISIIFMLKGL